MIMSLFVSVTNEYASVCQFVLQLVAFGGFGVLNSLD